MANTAAIRPEEVIQARKESMPDEVIQIFNELITQKFDGHRAIVHQGAVVKKLGELGYGSSEVFRMGWLDVEDIYRQQGWNVVYDKPGYNESYEAYFKFSK